MNVTYEVEYAGGGSYRRTGLISLTGVTEEELIQIITALGVSFSEYSDVKDRELAEKLTQYLNE